jgi:hypothetical protein
MKTARALTIISVFLIAVFAFADDKAPQQRKFAASTESLKAALKDLGAYSGGRLPTLTGFVTEGLDLGKYQRPYYEFKLEMEPQGDATLVRVKAHVSAWYGAPGSPEGMYKELPSNGRLESDLLDRLKTYLTDHLITATTDISLLEQHVASLKEEVATAQARRDQLRQQAKNLQDGASDVNRIFVSPLRTGVPVFSEPSENTSVILRAESEDEFEVTELQGAWYRVSIEGTRVGWLKRSQVRQLTAKVVRAPEESAAASAEPAFTVSREHIYPFAGEWERLKGKTALFLFIQPTSAASANSPSEVKLHFAESLFAERYAEMTHSSSSKQFDGIVMIFLDHKGGVAAATVSDIKLWREGALSRSAFLLRCSLDPHSAFKSKTAGPASPTRTRVNNTPAATAVLRKAKTP